MRQLSCLLHELTRQEFRSPGLFSEDIIGLEKQVEALDTERYKGAMVRSLFKRLLFGEIPTKRALRMEKKYARGNERSEILYQGVVSSDRTTMHSKKKDGLKGLTAAFGPLNSHLLPEETIWFELRTVRKR